MATQIAETIILAVTALFIGYQAYLLRKQNKENKEEAINTRLATYYTDLIDHIGIFLNFINYWKNVDVNYDYDNPYGKMLFRRDISNFEARRFLVTRYIEHMQDGVVEHLVYISFLEDDYIYAKSRMHLANTPIEIDLCKSKMLNLRNNVMAIENDINLYKNYFIEKLQEINTIK